MTIAREAVEVVCTFCVHGKVKGLDKDLNYVESTCRHCMGRGTIYVTIKKGGKPPIPPSTLS